MKSDLLIFVFIDALGADIAEHYGVFQEGDRHGFRSHRLKSVLGYSSAAVPTILTGTRPAKHDQWNFFRRAKGERGNLSGFRWLRNLPSRITRSGRVRGLLSRFLARLYGFRGYFQLYNVELRDIHRIDFNEVEDLFAAPRIGGHANLLQAINEKTGGRFFLSDWREPEWRNLDGALRSIRSGQVDAAFLYFAELDGLMHTVGPRGEGVKSKLRFYEGAVDALSQAATDSGCNPKILVCSDHGMHEVHSCLDLSAIRVRDRLDPYGGMWVCDSTMVRVWWGDAPVRIRLDLTNELEVLGLTLVTSADAKKWGVDFPHNDYGDAIFLVPGGVLINPSHMGTSPVRGMHGYSPDDSQTDAFCVTNLPGAPKGISDISEVVLSYLDTLDKSTNQEKQHAA